MFCIAINPPKVILRALPQAATTMVGVRRRRAGPFGIENGFTVVACHDSRRGTIVEPGSQASDALS